MTGIIIGIIAGILLLVLKWLLPSASERKATKKLDKMSQALEEAGIVPTYSRQGTDGSFRLAFDDNNKMLYYVTTGLDGGNCNIVPIMYRDIDSCEIETDEGTNVSENTTGKAVGRAMVGGMLAGGIGAAVGAGTTKGEAKSYHQKYNVIINLRGESRKRICLKCLCGQPPYSEDSIEYKMAIQSATLFLNAIEDAMAKGQLS